MPIGAGRAAPPGRNGPTSRGGTVISAASRQIVLSPASEGIRLDRFLASELQLSRAQVRRLLERAAISLDGRVLDLGAKGLALPAAGSLAVAPYRSPAAQRAHPDANVDLPELASGTGWVAVDKPAGMPVHPLLEDELGTALNALLVRRPEIHGVGEAGLRSGVVHRLDVDTSGALLFATNEASFARLRVAFAEHRVAKRYRAILVGDFDPPGGRLEMALPLTVARHRPAQVRRATRAEQERGAARVTRQSVQRLAGLRGATLVEIRPATGFLHQIRASMAHVGHPVLGDARYGGAGELAQACGVTRHLLHACAVELEEIAAESPDPPDFAACLASLGGGGGERAGGAS